MRPTACAVCARPIAQAAVGRPRLTCGHRCRQVAWAQWRLYRQIGLERAEDLVRMAEDTGMPWARAARHNLERLRLTDEAD